MDDTLTVELQLERAVRGAAVVAARCHLGLPTVTRVPPVLDDGTPFPTLYWLTCPVARRRVSGLESAGSVRTFQERRNSDPEFAAACDQADHEYVQDRDHDLPPTHEGPAPRGGVAGTAGGVKCLHAHLAHHMAGGANPIGAEVDGLIGAPGCEVPCVGCG